MQRNCDVCGRPYQAKRKDSLTCSASCRSRKRHQPAGGSTTTGPDNSLVEATTRELEAVGKLDTMLGQQALALAKRMGTEVTGIAALSKELSRVMDAALGTAQGPANPQQGAGDDVDELRARRDAKRAG